MRHILRAFGQADNMDVSSKPSFLGLDGLHVFVTGAAGGIGSQAVREFLGKCLYVWPVYLAGYRAF